MELLRHITYSNQREYIQRVHPPIDLANFIDSYVIFESINLEDCAALSDGVPTLVFLPRPDISVKFTSQGRSIDIGGAWFCGHYLKQVKITCETVIDQLLIIRLQADALRQLDLIASKNLQREKAFPLKFLFGGQTDNLLSLIYSTSDIHEKLGFFEQFLRSHLVNKHSQNYLLRDAMKCIGKHHGNISIQEVVKQVGANYKWLERNFHQCLGMGPKEYARTQRILQSYQLLSEGENPLLAIALKSGFYDRNHLLKDFKRFFGESPSTYWKRHGAS
ncbi:AraC family transcriptional regulator [Olivibacter sp. CPCC 100613]|uniref:helix-turn-helix transcriptional regulator n=1 Tax=Olivibacter sp. CPCC 100613 TaxID=3079931 RepID=UPI002FFAE862